MKFLRSLKSACSFVCLLVVLCSALMARPAFADDFQRFSLVPVMAYTEETEFQYGAMLLLFVRPDNPGEKVPEIGVTAFGTTRKQMQLTLEPFYYFYHDQISMWAVFRYQDWFASHFGAGNDPDIDIHTDLDRKRFYLGNIWESSVGMPKGFKYGIEIHIENTENDFNEESFTGEPGQELPLPDPHSGWRNGFGYVLSYDSRDNTNWSKHGFLVQWKQLFYSDKLGDYTFNEEDLDIRGYTPLIWGATFAQGFLWKRTAGDVPFDMLAGPDGVKRFRGVESLYFNGNQAIITQSEIRKYFAYRVGGHVFFETGKAGDYFSDLWREKWHKSVGAGALLGLNLSADLFARADVSWVDFDHFGISFNVRQAF